MAAWNAACRKHRGGLFGSKNHSLLYGAAVKAPSRGGATEQRRGREGKGRGEGLSSSRPAAPHPPGVLRAPRPPRHPWRSGLRARSTERAHRNVCAGLRLSAARPGTPGCRAPPALARHDAVGRSDSRRAEPSCLGSQPGGRSRGRRREGARSWSLVSAPSSVPVHGPRRTSRAPRRREARAQPRWASQGGSAPSQNSKRSLTHCFPPRTHASAHLILETTPLSG